MSYFYQAIKSPIGILNAAATDKDLVALLFEADWEKLKPKLSPLVENSNEILDLLKSELTEYFAGKRKSFSIAFTLNGTEFQKQTWQALESIPFGKTINYQQQAMYLNRPKAIRAIGTANGKNPVCIILPCHRVIGKNGSLTGYAGGLTAKKYLLELESTYSA